MLSDQDPVSANVSSERPATPNEGPNPSQKTVDAHAKPYDKVISKERTLLTAEDIKQSKDRINSLRNIFPFYGHLRQRNLSSKLCEDTSEKTDRNAACKITAEAVSKVSKERLSYDEEKDTCDKSDSDSIQSFPECKTTGIVHSRIASYELPYKKTKSASPQRESGPIQSVKETNKSSEYLLVSHSQGSNVSPSVVVKSQTLDGSCLYAKPNKGKLSALKERCQNSVTNLTYEGFSFGIKEKKLNFESNKYGDKVLCKVQKKKQEPQHMKSEEDCLDDGSSKKISSQDSLISRLQSEIVSLETSKTENSNIIFGNKDVLKLLSNKHLANLNIRVEKNYESSRKDNRYNIGSFRASKTGIRTSFRSSKRRKKQNKYRQNVNSNNDTEEKGASDSTLKENESEESEIEIKQRICDSRMTVANSDCNYSAIGGKKKIPEYAKVIKRKTFNPQIETDVLPRSLSTSPIERGPVVKKIYSSGARLKKDTEPSLMVNPVKKVDSFRGSRVTRRNSFLHNSKAKATTEQGSFVKTQAIKLKRRNSKAAKKSEYRVSVTIRPSTVSNLANKFNTIILQNQSGMSSSQNDVTFGKVSVVEAKVPRYYSSPRASFKRKYRQKAAKTARENKEKEYSSETQHGIENTIYYAENISATQRRSLNNSLAELNMKDLFENYDYNKTDEEKVCEKLKTALSSAKFKGETDDSEDDLSSRIVNADGQSLSESCDLTLAPLESEFDDKNVGSVTRAEYTEQQTDALHKDTDSEDKTTVSKYDADVHIVEINETLTKSVSEGHSKNDSIDSGISADEDKRNKDTQGNKEYNEEDEEVKNKTRDNCGVGTERKRESQFVRNCQLSSSDIHKFSDNSSKDNSFSCLESSEILAEHNKENIIYLSSPKTNKSFDSGIPSSPQIVSHAYRSGTEMKSNDNRQGQKSDIVDSTDKTQIVPDDLLSDCNSVREDSYSEVSSICSDAKYSKTKGDTGIYKSLKTAVKNTVRKTKEKDTERKRSKERRKHSPITDKSKLKRSPSKDKNKSKSSPSRDKNKSKSSPSRDKNKSRSSPSREKNKSKSSPSRDENKSKISPSRDKNKWYRRGKSKERKVAEKPDAPVEKTKDSESRGKKEKEGKLYEKWAFRRKNRNTSKDRKQEEKQENQENVNENCLVSKTTGDSCISDDDRYSSATDSDIYQDFTPGKEEDTKDSLYGKLKFASRSRSREKRNAKKRARAESRLLTSKAVTIREETEPSMMDSGDIGSDVKKEHPVPLLTDNNEAAEQNEESFNEPHSPSGVKIIPPPPKTPIPSPPTSIKSLVGVTTSKSSTDAREHSSNMDDSSSSLDKNYSTENIYDNLYSPNLQKLKRNREKLEGQGIKPNSSFLWSDTAVVLTQATFAKANIIREKEFESDDKTPSDKECNDSIAQYDKIGSPSLSDKPAEDSGSDGHNYTEIQNNSSGDSQTVAYDDIGAISAVSYDEIAAPSSCGYDDIRPASTEGEFDPYRVSLEGYDPVNPPKSDSSQYDECDGAMVTAQLAVVREDQIDSLSYVYDDVSMYNASIASHSYEPVCPPDTSKPSISTIVESPLGEASCSGDVQSFQGPYLKDTEPLLESDEGEYGPHEVFSYKLTPMTSAAKSTFYLPPASSSTREATYGLEGSWLPRKSKLFKSSDFEECESKRTSSESTVPASAVEYTATKFKKNRDTHDCENKSFASAATRSRRKLPSSPYLPSCRDRGREAGWEDITGNEEDEKHEEIPLTLTTKIPIVRKHRPKRVARLRVTKKSWTQGVRDVAAHNRIPRAQHKNNNGHSTNLAKVQSHHAHARTHCNHARSHAHIRTSTDHVITYSWRQKPSGPLDGIRMWQNGTISPPARTPSKLSTSSSSSNSSSSCDSCSSSSSSSFSSIASHSSCTLPGTPVDKDAHEDQVYVSASSSIIIIGSDDISNIYDTAYESASSYYNASNVSSCGTNYYYESAKIRSIFYEDDSANEHQEISCYVEGSDTDNEDEGAGHYEAIYEVISPTEDEKPTEDLPEEEEDAASFVDDLQGPADDDSFDSDEFDGGYSRLLPQYLDADKYGAPIRDRVESFSSDNSADKCDVYQRHKYGRSFSQQPHSMNKLAEAANLGMKRLRRNWSVTKNEVRTGLNKIKKKSAFSMADMKSAEDILSAVGSSGSDKGKWSLKSHFRRKSTSSTLPPSITPPYQEGKDKATFYLTLTIASDGQEGEDKGFLHDGVTSSSLERRNSSTPSVSSVATTASCDTAVSSSRSRPLSVAGTALLRNSSSGSNSGILFRPKTAPPAPPVDTDDDDSMDMFARDKLAFRLNQILAAGPVAPPGKKVLRTSECSSSESSPLSLVLPLDDKSFLFSGTDSFSLKYSAPAATTAADSSQSHKSLSSRTLPSELKYVIQQNIPKARNSVSSTTSSQGSTGGYIKASDIASAPPPLPVRPTLIPGSSNTLKRLSLSNLSQSNPNISAPLAVSATSDIDNRSYLDLNCEPEQDEPPYMSSHFPDEQLYQFYTAKAEIAALYQADSSEDDYEVINDGGLNTDTATPSRPTAMELVSPVDRRRTLWCELPEVITSGILATISSRERKVQEAAFEVITSEASYLKSLEVLVNHFMNCPEFSRAEDPVITRRNCNVLFSDILPVKKCSEMFLADLEKRWQESYFISGITDIVLKHAKSSFNVYVKYCSNQIYQDRMLRDLKENNSRFVEVLNRLESSPLCQSLAMHSFLMLPMQRITRLPLLVDAIFNRLEYGSSQWQECKKALATLTEIVAECNEGARKMERMEEMLLISHQLDFREVRAIPLISASRWLVKKGELTRLTWREGDAKLTFGRKISKHSLYFFLFTDLLVVTKKKSEDQHMVLDYCPRNMVQVLELESADKFPGRLLDGHKNLIIMTMLQNHENKTVEMVLSCPLESDRTRWMEAVTPRISENPDERIYEEWDCPQVQVRHSYVATQPDELSLEVSDVINVLKKTSDGWFQGERLRDGSRGWFPGNHTVEIASAHVRARNLRQRYRLLAISGSIVDELKKEKERFEREEKKKERRRTITMKDML